MKRTVRRAASAAILAVLALAALGCRPVDINSVNVPENFEFKTTHDIAVKVSVEDGDGKAAGGAEVIVAATEGKLNTGDFIARGFADHHGRFERLVRVPARFDSLHVQAAPLGVPTGADVPIENSEVSVSFGPQS